MRITAYVLIFEKDIQDFEDAITKNIGDGWQPFGSIAVSLNEENEEWLYQPMVKYE